MNFYFNAVQREVFYDEDFKNRATVYLRVGNVKVEYIVKVNATGVGILGY